MKKFIFSFLLFIGIYVIIFICIFFMPVTPSAKESLLFSSLQKDSLLKFTPSPRIIFLGGSNVAYGLDSQLIKDSLSLNPINASIHAGLGLKYMLDHIEDYLKKGDVLVILPEYQYFFGDGFWGSDELLRTLIEVNPSELNKLDLHQYINIIPYIPYYLKSKIRLNSYLKEIPFYYKKSAFNQYGDAVKHWGYRKQRYNPYPQITSPIIINKKAFDYFCRFISDFEAKEIKVYISYPSLQDESFDNLKPFITTLEKQYKQKNLPVIGTPNEYRMPDSLTFDTPYHLKKEGAELRTRILIRDLKPYL